MGYGFDTGTYSLKVTTKSADAQRWFDRGLIWAYGFHWEEAVGCFIEALKEESEFAMVWWGLAYSYGPEYNRMWHQVDEI